MKTRRFLSILIISAAIIMVSGFTERVSHAAELKDPSI